MSHRQLWGQDQDTWLLQAAAHALRCFSSSTPGMGDTSCTIGVPITESLCLRGQGHFLGNKDKPVVPTEIVHGKGIVWIKLDFCTQGPRRLVGVTVTMKTVGWFTSPHPPLKDT